jgi:class 3 adenylate cyclase
MAAVDIEGWLRELGLERYAHAFCANAIDARSLPHLTGDDLRELGVTAIGHRRLLLQAIADLHKAERSGPQANAPSVESSLQATAKPEAERRQLTVMFCDLVGSTQLAAQLDPEDLGRVIRAYQDRCAEVVERWGGRIAKYMGDGVLAYFGWPRAHEDEAERAVWAGLELVQNIAKLDTPANGNLAARIGIATGLVMVGELIGEGSAREEAVVGETPNLAARLQALAPAGGV